MTESSFFTLEFVTFVLKSILNFTQQKCRIIFELKDSRYYLRYFGFLAANLLLTILSSRAVSYHIWTKSQIDRI